MRYGFIKLFGRKKTVAANHPSDDDMLQRTRGTAKKRSQKNKKTLPFFRKVRIWSTAAFLIVFSLSLLGHISFSTIDASFSKGTDASLPSNVKEVKDEYTDIKNDYSKFNFTTFKKILGQGVKGTGGQEEDMWGKLSETFFGNDHLKYMKTAVEKSGAQEISPEEAGLQTPQITVSGMSMKNDNEMVVSLAFNGRQETWLMQKKGGKWTSNSLPVEYVLIDAKPDAKNEIPYFEIGLRTAPDLRWKVQMANTAVKTQGKISSGTTPEVVSEMDKMRTAGSYIMVKENGKVKYVNMAPPAPAENISLPGMPGMAPPGTGGARQPGGNIINVSGEQMNDIPPEIQKIIQSIPVEMPVTAPGGSQGTLKTTLDVTKDQPAAQQTVGISNVQPIPMPQPVQDMGPSLPQFPESVPQGD